MTKILVASFTDEKTAMDAYKQLTEWESLGDISLYDKIMIRKKQDGGYESIKGVSNEGWRTFTDTAIGGLLGAFGGPIGFVMGIYAGSLVAVVSEVNHLDFEAGFIKKIENKAAQGTISIIAETDEEDTDFLLLSLKRFNAEILLTDVDYAYDDYMTAQIDEVEDEIAGKREGLKKEIGKEKEKIEKKITALKDKRTKQIASFNAELKKKAEKMKDATVPELTRLKQEVKLIGNKVEQGINDGKTNRIKRSIARHEARLVYLKRDLQMLV